MKLLAAFMLFFATSSALAATCDSAVRAPTSDQKHVVSDVTNGYLLLDSRQLIEWGLYRYESWKGAQTGCIADVFHFGHVYVKYTQEGQVCSTSVVLYAKDHFMTAFTTGTTAEREYKVQTATEPQCVNAAPASTTTQCLQMDACKSPSGDTRAYIRDINDSCLCKAADDLIAIPPTDNFYDDFFSPEASFPIPSDLKNPFTE